MSGTEERRIVDVIPRPTAFQFDNVFRDGKGARGRDYAVIDQYIESLKQRRPEAYRTDVPYSFIYLPTGSERVEFDFFRHVPTVVGRWARSCLRCGRKAVYPFRFQAMNMAEVFLDGTLVHETVSVEALAEKALAAAQDIELDLDRGDHEVVVHFSNFARLNSGHSFSMVYLGEGTLETFLPGMDSAAGNELAALLKASALERSVIDVDESLILGFPRPLPFDMALDVWDENTETVRYAALTAPKGSAEAVLSAGRDLPVGGLDLVLYGRSGNIRIPVKRHAVVTKKGVSLRGGSLAERKRKALEYLADWGVDGVATALARLEASRGESRVEPILRAQLARIEDRADCVDFQLPPLLWLYREHAGKRLAPSLRDGIRRGILGFRYWFDEPGRDTMWFFSENHALCFHAAEYLAGTLFPDDVFPNSGLTGREKRRIGRERLDLWFSVFEQQGLVEWNSASYYPVDLIGLIVLLEMAPDESIRARAKSALDFVFRMVAMNGMNGILCGAQGRTYTRDLLDKACSEVANYSAILWGVGEPCGFNAASSLLALSDYEPPEELGRYADYRGSKAVLFEILQGTEEPAYLSSYKTKDVLLAAVSDHKTGRPGSQQHVCHVSFLANREAHVWVNHPGESDPYGQKRPSYWAGNGTLPRVFHHADTVLLVYRVQTAHEVDFTHAYFPERCFDEVEEKDGCFFARSGDAFLALWAAEGLRRQEEGRFHGCELLSPGRVNAWAVAVSSASNGDFGSFQGGFLRGGFRFDGSVLRMKRHGEELACVFEGPCTVNGRPVDCRGYVRSGAVRFL